MRDIAWIDLCTPSDVHWIARIHPNTRAERNAASIEHATSSTGRILPYRVYMLKVSKAISGDTPLKIAISGHMRWEIVADYPGDTPIEIVKVAVEAMLALRIDEEDA